MADINTAPDGVIQKPTILVYTKASLTVATDWTLRPYLRCDKVTRRVNGMDTATLRYEAGANLRQIDSATQGESAPLSLRNQFVRVTFSDSVLGDFSWTGYITDDVEHREIEVPQIMQAVGLEYFLDRRQIGETVIDDGKRLGRVVPFNDASGANGFATAGRGNMTTGSPASGVKEFADAADERTEWTAKHIVEYLVEHFNPRDNSNLTSPCTWSSSLGSVLDDYILGFDPDGMTVYQVLNAVINPRRSLVWWLEYSEVSGLTGTATINVAPLNQAAVTLPGGGGELPANVTQFTLDYDADPTVMRQQITTLSRGNYKAIRCRGARITSTFTAQVGFELIPDWLSALETEYLAGASGDATMSPAYGTLDGTAKGNRNDAFRRAERFYRVFAAYRIPPDWNGESGSSELCFPDSLIGGAGSANMTYHANWLRILPRTLLARGADYETVASIAAAADAETGDDLMPPFAVLQVTSSPANFQMADKISTSDFASGTAESGTAAATAYHLAVQQDTPGILLRASGGYQHTLALNHWGGAEPTEHDPELDYETMVVTCSVECDHYAEAVYPSVVASGPYEELTIYAGDQYRLDFLVPDTVVDVRGGVRIQTDGGIIRDDRDQLEDIARFAYEWYQAPKRTLAVAWRQLRTWFELGYMITDLGDADPTTLNTVVGQLEYDLVALTTTITTVGDTLNVKEVA